MASGSILVLYVPAGGGHKSAALSLVEAGRARGLDIEALDALSLAPPWFARAYVEAHLIGSGRVPGLYGGAFAASNHPDPVREHLRGVLDRAVGRELGAHVAAARPSAVIATHFYPLTELGRLRRAGEMRAPLLAVVTDYVAHALWSVPGVDLYCAAAGRASADLRAHGTHGAPVAATGIPVREAFGRAPAWAPPREGEPLRVLVTSGGFGVGPVLSVLEGLGGAPGLCIDVVCGDRPRLVERARRRAAELGLDALVTGFASDMPERVARAHVVVGKPGGLTMSECLAAGRPLVAVGACPGQESENEAALVGWGAGSRSAPRRLGRHLAELRASGALSLMAASARTRGAPGAAPCVLSWLPRPAAEAA